MASIEHRAAVNLIFRGPPFQETKFQLIEMDEAGCGKLDIAHVKEFFQLKTIQLDGKAVDIDVDGIGLQCFKPGSTHEVTGEIDELLIPSGKTVILELEGDPTMRRHFDLYDFNGSAGRINLDDVCWAFGVHNLTLDDEVLLRKRGTDLSEHLFPTDATIVIKGMPAPS